MTIIRDAHWAAMDDPLLLQAGVVGRNPQGNLELTAAADAMGPGAALLPMFQPQIVDIVNRRGVLGQRLQAEPATGQPSRYFEQTRIVTGQFQDPRNLTFAPGADPTRRERLLTIKANVAACQFGLFDVAVTRQQGQFAGLVAKDVNDMVDGTMKTSDLALWTGTDTNLVFPTSLQYVGLLTQINRTASIPSTLRIIDGLKAEIAALRANVQFRVRPTAVYVNPVLGDLIDQEERLNQRQMPQVPLNNVTGGLVVNGLATQAGPIPIIPDEYLTFTQGGSVTESGKTDYKAVILSEPMIERHYVLAPEPQVYQLGLGPNLGTQYMCVLFDAVVAKGNANASQPQNVVESGIVTYAHSVVTVTR